MVSITSLLAPERCQIAPAFTSQKALMETLSQLIIESTSPDKERHIFNQLIEREKLGSTGIGDGVALPHIRSSAVDHPVAAFIRLDTPIDFKSEDHCPVDLIFGLIVPEDVGQEHLNILAKVAQIFHNPEWRDELRAIHSNELLWDKLNQYDRLVTVYDEA